MSKAFAARAILTASGQANDGSGLLQTVSVRQNSEGGAHVHVEHYSETNWDRTIDEIDRDFVDLPAALDWLQTLGVAWSQLTVPEAPAGR